VPCKSIR